MQGSLFDDDQVIFFAKLPDQSRMPLNLAGRRVYSVVMKDLCHPADALVVTGYSGLEQLIQLITSRGNAPVALRLILGSEPVSSRAPRFSLKRYDFCAEMRAYWLERGISLALSGQVLRCIELIRSGHVRVRYSTGSTRLHAKLYCAAEGATLGSSNFTWPGLHTQREANVRFTPSEKARFSEVWQVAECYWSQGEDADQAFVSLLEQLLKFVTWQEVLSRACAELLESEWASHYLHSLSEIEPVDLWPAQRQGVGQALYLLDTVGAVLVADATGSGKTRLGAHLLRAIHDRNWSSMRARKGSMLLVCPPLVGKSWVRETARCGFNVTIVSQGMLSRLSEKNDSALALQLSSAQTLAVDEAHNFLSQTSNRTRQLKHNLADQVVLFTATPINRTRADLLRLIDILGADNFDDEVIAVFERLSKGGKGVAEIHVKDLEALQSAIASFTLRRTKSQLNAMVERNPEAYQLANGRLCCYPKQLSSTYTLSESSADCALADEIRQLARQLKGISHFRKPLVLSDSWCRYGVTADIYLNIRLRAARSLALYHVMSSLRSSRLALYRHLEGEGAAWRRIGLSANAEMEADEDTGNMLGRLSRLEGQIPENCLGIQLPAWLSNSDAHRRACVEERAIYARIRDCLDKMSNQRELSKVDLLVGLLSRHDQVLAFDHYPLTLRYLAYLLKQRHPQLNESEVILGVGGDRRRHEQIQAMLDPAKGSMGRLVALCSDALSEGVNLQRASTLVHLDMPSVVRVAEQRVGRIDRMDSPHTQIETWWPKDAQQFALRSDETFVFRVDEVDTLLGGNLLLPEDMRAQRDDQIITSQELEDQMREREQRSWDGIEDAFAPVRALVHGPEPLIQTGLYDQYRSETAKVMSRVSVVKAGEPWLFICLAGERARAPRWVLLTHKADRLITELREITLQLRDRLPDTVQTLEPTRAAMEQLQRFMTLLSEMEKLLLPKRKQRAIEQLCWAIALWAKDRNWLETPEHADQIKQLLNLIEGTDGKLAPDWGQLADIWLELIRPRWAQYLQSSGRKATVMRLRDLQPGLKRKPIEAALLLKKLSGIELRRPWEQRIVACILGCGAGTQANE